MKKKQKQPGTVAHACNAHAREAGTGDSLRLPDQPKARLYERL